MKKLMILLGIVLIVGCTQEITLNETSNIESTEFCGDGKCNEPCDTCPSDCDSDYRVCCDSEYLIGDCCGDSDCNEGYKCVDNYCEYQRVCDGTVHSCCGEGMINLFDDSENMQADGSLYEDTVIVMNYSSANESMTLYYNGYTKKITSPGVFKGSVYNMLSVSQPVGGGLWFCFRKTSISADEVLIHLSDSQAINGKNITIKSADEVIVNGESGVLSELSKVNKTIIELKGLINDRFSNTEAVIIKTSNLAINEQLMRQGDYFNDLENNTVQLDSINSLSEVSVKVNGQSEIVSSNNPYHGNVTVELIQVYNTTFDLAAVLSVNE